MAVVAAVNAIRLNRERVEQQQQRNSNLWSAALRADVDAKGPTETLDARTSVMVEEPAWYEKKELGLGQVIALHGRRCGRNGIFLRGEIGEAMRQEDGTVLIIWPNGSASQTTWPNLAWYRGCPRTYDADWAPALSTVGTDDGTTTVGESDEQSDARSIVSNSYRGSSGPPSELLTERLSIWDGSGVDSPGGRNYSERSIV
mmetsp:Transcript_25885/g.65296  ORF Transcript_25885/g.65296 Transcript_25885/m.65296 type:complete len:201 (-) Transcript_25885:21-623(-)